MKKYSRPIGQQLHLPWPMSKCKLQHCITMLWNTRV